MTSQVELIEILLVEDNPGDIELTREAFSGSKIANRLHVVSDGEGALDFLFRRGEWKNTPMPGLVLLDINLPRLGGKEVLEIIKADEHLRMIPVVMLAASEAERDIARSYQLHANGYVSKPVTLESFVKVVHSLEEFWLGVVKLPAGA